MTRYLGLIILPVEEAATGAQPLDPRTRTCLRSLEERRAEVPPVVGRIARPPTWPGPAAPAAVPELAPRAVSSQPAGQSRAGPAGSPSSQPCVIHRGFPELLCVSGTSLSARNRHASGPGVPPRFISLWLPRAAVRTKESHFQCQALDADHLVICDPTLFFLSPSLPLLTLSPTNRRLFTG